MLTDRESRVIGPLVVAVGTAFFAAGLARILWPAADGTIYLASLGIGFGFPLLAAGLWSLWADKKLTDADLADRAADRVVKLRVPPSAPLLAVADKQGESEYDAERDAWRVALDRFFRAGDAAGGFSAGKLAGVAGSDAWPRLVHFYASKSGGNVLRDAGGNTGHQWGHGWTLDRVMLALGNDRLPRPEIPLPVIAPYVASATQRRAPQKSKTAVIVENKPTAAP